MVQWCSVNVGLIGFYSPLHTFLPTKEMEVFHISQNNTVPSQKTLFYYKKLQRDRENILLLVSVLSGM